MSRIGIFAGPRRIDGGGYQYTLSILSACVAIADNELEFVVAVTSEEWAEHASQLGLPWVPVKEGFVGRAIRVALTKNGALAGFSRRYLSRIHRPSKALLDQNCDLWFIPFPTTIADLAPLRSIGVIHDLMHRYERRFPEVGKRQEFRSRERRFGHLCRHSAFIMVDSNCGSDHVQECYGVERSRVLVQPFLPPSYIFQSRNQPTVNEKFKLPDKYLIYPAQFWPHKNHARLLQAFARALRTYPDAVIVLCGALRLEYQNIFNLAKALGIQNSVIFLGYVPDEDIGGLYLRARALIYPTFFGPTNIPPLEAFALGCPVAASDIYGMREQLGDAALFFDPESEEQMADAISALWHDDGLCAELRELGFARSQSWTAVEFAQRLREHLVIASKKSPHVATLT